MAILYFVFISDGDLLQIPVKKHKKHKHKKHKRKKADTEIEGTSSLLKMPVLNPTEEELDVLRYLPQFYCLIREGTFKYN